MAKAAGMIVSLFITLGAWGLTGLLAYGVAQSKDAGDAGIFILIAIVASIASTIWTARLANYLVTGDKDFT